MSQYTPEQVEQAVNRMRVASPNDLEVERMLLAYAATIRQPAARVDGWKLGDVDKLDDADLWTAGIDVPVGPHYSTEGIHSSAIECHAATKEAAELLRSQVMRAAHAQNTPDGEAVAGMYSSREIGVVAERVEAAASMLRQLAGEKQSHAERAMVPDGWREFIEGCANSSGGMVNGNHLAARAKALLAAAPSQPAQDVEAVDVGAIREVIESLRYFGRLFGANDLRLQNTCNEWADALTRALSGGKAGIVDDVVREVIADLDCAGSAGADHYSADYLLDVINDASVKLAKALPASPTPEEQG